MYSMKQTHAAKVNATGTGGVSRPIRTMWKRETESVPVTKDGQVPPAGRPERNSSKTRHGTATCIKEYA